MHRAWALVAFLVGCSPAPVPSVAPTPAPREEPKPSPEVLDRDGDGVADARDRCPDDWEDCDGFEDDDGCPDLDDDGDGIADACDRCPRDPGDEPDGCPRKRVRVEESHIRIVVRVSFERGSAEPPKSSLPILDEVANVLAANPAIELLEISGHASKDEPDAAALSRKRATRVKALLVARGVAEERLVVRAAGAAEPIDSGTTRQTRARNRRVDWKILRVAESTTPPVPIAPERPKREGPPHCPGEERVPPPLRPPPGGCPQARRSPNVRGSHEAHRQWGSAGAEEELD